MQISSLTFVPENYAFVHGNYLFLKSIVLFIFITNGLNQHEWHEWHARRDFEPEFVYSRVSYKNPSKAILFIWQTHCNCRYKSTTILSMLVHANTCICQVEINIHWNIHLFQLPWISFGFLQIKREGHNNISDILWNCFYDL